MNNKFSISADDVKKTARGLLITMAGAGLAFAAQWVSNTDFGTLGPILIVPALGGLIELGRRYLSDTSK